MDFIWILFAFACGLGVRLLSLPPLVGYLIAGFGLNFMGVEPDHTLQTLADLGITLMLFTIGLKLSIRDLLKPEIWAGTNIMMGVWILLFGGILLGVGAISVSIFTGLTPTSAALIAFASSFSSTVCVVKMLEDSGETRTRHGRLAIGVLVMQDIIAVLFLVFATGELPSAWALLLFALIPARPLIGRLLNSAGHGELLPLTGFFLALGGYELFALVNIKGDLGALIAGILLSQHTKAAELVKSLMSFKDLFLIGFFLSIGFTALPDWSMLGIALCLTLLLPLKFALFFTLLSGLKLRARTAYLTSLALANYSEFGLIVAAISVSNGWLDKQWLVILALAVSISFVFTSTVYRSSHNIYRRHKDKFRRLERSTRLPEDIIVQPTSAEILVIGLGRVGSGAYQSLYQEVGDRVWGMDADRERIRKQKEQGMHVFFGDGEDADLWETLDTSSIKLILLALPTIEDSINVCRQLQSAIYCGQIAAIARYEDERMQLLESGIDKVFNFYTEAGTGFADESLRMINAR
ncbi:cation:proton antiporter [Aestuariicella hydrocarbonica]|uniref:Cation:proton antiporter n=1 Tax=Pseudomaricurvus hydrocarbonicus TaxID=1470433 RepID=A0A9E5MPY2_9GAMM|nr:cation:proton antiporter family protein [Aestuariicella hydrocarbonica]NHO68157.1 cation:proton antiporter [Aestuariicella hydrocarbonica]